MNILERYAQGDRDFSGADLRGADLSYADLRGADLRGANLSYADLRGANLSYADLRGADLSGANLSGADLYRTGIVRIYTSYEATIYPDGRIAYGCETLSRDEWDARLLDLCSKHEPNRFEEFAAEIRAILALADVITTRKPA